MFTDKASGKDTRRPELDRLLAFVRDGDEAERVRRQYDAVEGRKLVQ
jgi:DNA invertase Pin-like site-specific DNA recombinase